MPLRHTTNAKCRPISSSHYFDTLQNRNSHFDMDERGYKPLFLVYFLCVCVCLISRLVIVLNAIKFVDIKSMFLPNVIEFSVDELSMSTLVKIRSLEQMPDTMILKHSHKIRIVRLKIEYGSVFEMSRAQRWWSSPIGFLTISQKSMENVTTDKFALPHFLYFDR